MPQMLMDRFFQLSRIVLLGILLLLGVDLAARFAMEENNINWKVFATSFLIFVITWLVISGIIYCTSLWKNKIVTYEKDNRRTISCSLSEARSNFISNIKYFLAANIVPTFFLVSIIYADKSVSYSLVKIVFEKISSW